MFACILIKSYLTVKEAFILKFRKGFSVLIILFLFSFLMWGCTAKESTGGEEEVGGQQGANDSSKKVNFPEKPIKINVGSAAGAPIDIMSRQFAEIAQEYIGQTISVENRPGGSTQVAMAYTLSQPADGYELQAEASSLTTVLQTRDAELSYEEFVPIVRLELDPFALYVHPESGLETIDDFINKVKESEGELKVGGYGTGSPHHITAMQLAQSNDIEFKWVAYNSGSDAITDLIGGSLDAVMSNGSQMVRYEDQIVMLGHTAEEPLPKFPDVPSFQDQGHDIVKYHWRGLLAKKGTPQEVIDVLVDAFTEAQNSPEWEEYLDNVGNLNGYMPQPEFETFIHKQAEIDLKVLQELGLAD